MTALRVWRMILAYAFRDPGSLNRRERRERGVS
jgi:hypothetical protein